MKRAPRLLALVALAGAATLALRPPAPVEAQATPQAAPRVERIGGASPAHTTSRATGSPEAQRAAERRRDLFVENLAAVDAAIAAAEGGDAEYVAALTRRRELLAAQASAEADEVR